MTEDSEARVKRIHDRHSDNEKHEQIHVSYVEDAGIYVASASATYDHPHLVGMGDTKADALRDIADEYQEKTEDAEVV